MVLAILLMMAVAILPSMFLKTGRRAGGPADSAAVARDTVVVPTPAPVPVPVPDTLPVGPSARPPAEDTVRVASPLYSYDFSTRGARLVDATFPTYRSMKKEDAKAPAQILYPGGDLLSLGLLVGRDTISFRDWTYAPSAEAVDAAAPSELTFTSERGAVGVSITYRFRPDDYRFEARGTVRGLGATGGILLVGLGPGLRNTESDSVEHQRELGVVVKGAKAELTRFSKLRPGTPVALNGPYEWVAVKSKYFVTAILAPDTTGGGLNGGIAGATAVATDPRSKSPLTAEILAGLPVPASGEFQFQVYAGPMEYNRLRAIGHDFDDVNPYGWAWLRPIIRPVAVGGRWLLVWMHDKLGLAYGLGLIAFGILIRILLWPLNQKAMRSSMAMQAIQPHMKALQEKHKEDPARLQQEMFKLYKEHNVNPFGGCWPMLLPWPILIALFFVFQNTIELRGATFLWIPDLSRPDPLYVIPVLMGLSMYALTKIGQLGMEPNPQMKMMLYIMPGMMTFLFLNFASGLNLYYTVMNLASLPQQWLLAKERVRRNPPAPTKPPPPIPPKKRG
ncbi:MAG TPA: membrane protein insertase YidC [Gemmatimonadales bacterium]|nr:membrane protein insertase YidC [Gemmatimonadales bacterium]